MITDRDEEFRNTITFFYRQELGREPDPNGLESWLGQLRGGMTGAQLQEALRDSAEGVAYRSKPPAPIVAPAAAVERLHVEGLGFVTESSKPWTMAFITGFRDYERFLNGEDIEPLLVETTALGGNGRRVFGAFDFGSPNVQRLYPREHGDYYDRLQEFCNLFAKHGLWVEFVVFADTARSVPGVAAQLVHWAALCDQLRECSNVLLERVNENDQHDNRVDAALPKPVGICSSFGSNGGGNDPPGPFWDYACLHSERRGDFALSTTTVNFSVKGYVGENAAKSFGGTQRCTVVCEPPGIADANVGGRRTADPRVCYQMGVGCATWGAGGTAHSECGVMSVLHTPVQAECVRQFLAGVKR